MNRFLTGEVSLDNIWTDGLLDTWTIPDANADMPGFTFSALDDEAVKRVSSTLKSHMYNTFHLYRLITFLPVSPTPPMCISVPQKSSLIQRFGKCTTMM